MIIKVKIRTLKKLYMVFLMFIMIFAPPFLPKTNLFLSVFCIGMIFCKYQEKQTYVFNRSGQAQWFLTMVIMFTYALILIGINGVILGDLVQTGHYTALFNRFLVLTVTMIPCCTYCICYFEANCFEIDDLVRFIIYTALIQAALIFMSLISERVHVFFLSLLKVFGDSGLYENTWYVTTRSYGFATTLVDTFGMGMGIIAGISFIYGLYKEKKFLIYSLLIAIAGTLDARTTMIMWLAALLISIVFVVSSLKAKQILFFIAMIIMFVFGLQITLNIILKLNPFTYEWINAGKESLFSLFSGEGISEGDPLGALFLRQGRFQMPEIFRLIFGTGHSLYGAEGYLHSDVGYTNDLWFIGIIGVCFVYGSIAKLFVRTSRVMDEKYLKYILIYMGISLLIFNVKGAAIGYNPGAATVFAFLFIGCYVANKNEKHRWINYNPCGVRCTRGK